MGGVRQGRVSFLVWGFVWRVRSRVWRGRLYWEVDAGFGSGDTCLRLVRCLGLLGKL